MASPSRMTSRLKLQRLTEDVVAGNVVKTWPDILTCWCAVEWTGALETEKSTARQATFTVRANSITKTVTESDRIIHGGLTFAITAWLPIPADRPDIIKISASCNPI